MSFAAIRKAAHSDTLVRVMHSHICESLAISERRLEYPGELCVYPDSRWISVVHDVPGDHEMTFGKPMIRGGARSDEWVRSIRMNCPTCKSAMITLELAEVEVDHCVHCGGIWLDTGELEVLMDDPVKAKHLLDSFQEDTAVAEQPRRCPICERKMAKVVVGRSKPPLLIDKCRRTDGLWFDKGELQGILDRGELDKDSRIQGLLADIFGQDGRGQCSGSGS